MSDLKPSSIRTAVAEAIAAGKADFKRLEEARRRTADTWALDELPKLLRKAAADGHTSITVWCIDQANAAARAGLGVVASKGDTLEWMVYW